MLIIYVVAFIAIFYFMAIRPQQRQRKQHQSLLSSLKKGDRIMTASGIYGTVKRVEENIVVVEVAKGVSMKISRRAVAEIIRDQAEARAVAPEGQARGKNAPAEIEAAEETTTEETTSGEGYSSDSYSSDSYSSDSYSSDKYSSDTPSSDASSSETGEGDDSSQR
jgi:preprotein translocase subunit YajC